MLRFGGWLVSNDVVLFCIAIGAMRFGSQIFESDVVSCAHSLGIMRFCLHIFWGSCGFVCTYFGDHVVSRNHITI